MPPADIRIRPMKESDLERVLVWRSHPDVRRFMYTRHEISLAEHVKWFQECKQDRHKHLLIFEMGRVAMGYVNLTQIGCGQVADWGFYMAPNAPKGTGRYLGKAALNYAFDEIGLHKICGQALAFNERSIKFHQMLGFKHEGTLREQHFDDAIYHDVLCFGLIFHEWRLNPET